MATGIDFTIYDGVLKSWSIAIGADKEPLYMEIPEGVERVHEWAFGLSLDAYLIRELTVPSTCTDVRSLSSCTMLESVHVHEDNPAYSGKGGILYNKTGDEILFIPPKCTHLQLSAAFTAPLTKILPQLKGIKEFAVEEQNPLYGSENGALYNKQKTLLLRAPRDVASFDVPAGVRRIESYAFADCTELATVSLPAGLQAIGDYAFCGDTALETLDIPDSVVLLGENCFEGCAALTRLKLPANLDVISGEMLLNCKTLHALKIPAGVSRIAAHAFHGCSTLEEITLPQSVTHLGAGAFYGCSELRRVLILGQIPTIHREAFSGCAALEILSLPESLTELRQFAFGDCASLTHVFLPDGVTTVEDNAFKGCTALVEVSLPAACSYVPPHKETVSHLDLGTYEDYPTEENYTRSVETVPGSFPFGCKITAREA